MTQIRFYGHPLPGFSESELPGKFIVIEGTDGVGRSTQIALLQEWLEGLGFAVARTGMRRSALTGKGIDMAKRGHTLSDTVMYLLYLTDLADRLETQIIPALRAGMVVLTDRYIYSLIVRSLVRGSDPQWIRKVVGFALVPDAIFYLGADLDHLIPRVLSSRGFDYWESGMDFLKGRKLYHNYVRYQTRLLEQFDGIANEYGFRTIDANRSVLEVFADLRREVSTVVMPMKEEREAQPAALPTPTLRGSGE
jgi:dTMP kinase